MTQTIEAYCCDSCIIAKKKKPKCPADSPVKSCLCAMCGHYNTGSIYRVVVGRWLRIELAEDET